MGPYLVGFDTVELLCSQYAAMAAQRRDKLMELPCNCASILHNTPLNSRRWRTTDSGAKDNSDVASWFFRAINICICPERLRVVASKSMFVALLGTIYFVALRASWDQLREELGLVFFFVVLMLLMLLIKPKDYSWKRYLLLSLAIMAVVLSHELVSVLMFGTIILTTRLSLVPQRF